MITRRDFLGQSAAGLSAVSLSGWMPSLLARAAEASAKAHRNDRALVVVELSGGNDGLNTLIPFENALYYRNRPTLKIAKEEVVKLNDQVGFHPRMAPLGELFKDGKLAVVQGVGYPEPDRSHFRSMEIWHTASVNKQPPTTGWLGRLLDHCTDGKDNSSLCGLSLTEALPQVMQADNFVAPVVASLDALAEGDPQQAKMLRQLTKPVSNTVGPVAFLRQQAENSYRTAERLSEAAARYKSSIEYPENGVGAQLRRAAQILAGDLGTRVLFASQGGYDTHSAQADAHGNLLDELAAALAAFQRDLQSLKLADRVVTMVFSEFGRRVDENGSQGTDHGAASCSLLLGDGVQGGLVGTYPSLEKLGDGDLIFNTDFRSVYATILDGWLAAPSEQVLGGKFKPLDLWTKPA